jgi:beta-aspartyl-dipeptidase (metallo-type)
MFELLHNARVFAPEPLGVCELLIVGGRIAWIGSAADALMLPRALDVERRDLGGRRVVPGFVDGHAHVTGGGFEKGYASRVPPLAAGAFARVGVTSVVGLLGTDDLVHTPAELLTHVRGLCEQGLSAWCWTGGYHVPPATLTGSVRGDIVHLDRCIGVGELALSDHRSSQPTFDELVRIASECHVAGLMSGKAGVLHLHLGDGPRGLELVRRALDETELPARVFQPTHVNRRRALYEEALALSRRGVPIDITAFPVDEGDDAWAADAALVRYFEHGGAPELVSVSSDGGGCLPRFDADGRVSGYGVGSPAALADCIARLLRAGHALERVLPAFTSNVAAQLRLPRKGRLAAGGDADLVVLDDDHAVRDVLVGGVWHVRDGRPLVPDPFESPTQRSLTRT